jgi:hypothetical protein
MKLYDKCCMFVMFFFKNIFASAILLMVVFLLVSIRANAEERQVDMRDARGVIEQYIEKEGISPWMEDRNWQIEYWGQWTIEQRQSYLAGVQDAAEAIGFQMARGVGPKELLHAIVELFMESQGDIYTYMDRAYEPTGSGRITRWISSEVIEVLRTKQYSHAGTYLR